MVAALLLKGEVNQLSEVLWDVLVLKLCGTYMIKRLTGVPYPVTASQPSLAGKPEPKDECQRVFGYCSEIIGPTVAANARTTHNVVQAPVGAGINPGVKEAQRALVLRNQSIVHQTNDSREVGA